MVVVVVVIVKEAGVTVVVRTHPNMGVAHAHPHPPSLAPFLRPSPPPYAELQLYLSQRPPAAVPALHLISCSLPLLPHRVTLPRPSPPTPAPHSVSG